MDNNRDISSHPAGFSFSSPPSSGETEWLFPFLYRDFKHNYKYAVCLYSYVSCTILAWSFDDVELYFIENRRREIQSLEFNFQIYIFFWFLKSRIILKIAKRFYFILCTYVLLRIIFHIVCIFHNFPSFVMKYSSSFLSVTNFHQFFIINTPPCLLRSNIISHNRTVFIVFTWEEWSCVEWDAYSGFVNVGGRRRDALRAIANATLTMRSFEIQLKGVPSITGRRTPAPAPAASIKDRHGIYETASPADAALSANVKSISAINNSKLRRSWEFALWRSLFYY